MDKPNKFAGAWKWFLQTSTIVGVPVTFILGVMAAQNVLFTITCQTAGWRCEYSIGATDAMVEYMGQLVAANPNVDIVAKPRKKD